MDTNKINNNTTAKTKAKAEERVPVFIPKGLPKDDPNFYVSSNGVDYLLPKGQTSYVPPHVAKQIERHWKAVARYENVSNELISKTTKPTNM
jgi:hypothetical protein